MSDGPASTPKQAVQARRFPGMKLGHIAFFRFCQWLPKMVFKYWYGVKFRHLDRVPLRGPVLYVCNHQSYFDPPLLGCAPRRGVWFLARDTLFTIPVLGPLITALNSVPVKRGSSDTAAMRAVLGVLQNGGSTLVFPEGTRSMGGEVNEFQKGISLILKRAKCTVVPVAVAGMTNVWPRGAKGPKLVPRVLGGPTFGIMFGEPMESQQLLEAGAEEAMSTLCTEVEQMRRELAAELKMDVEAA